MEPISAGLGLLFTSSQMAGGLIDRITKLRDANFDAKALCRMLLLEVRYNLAVLDVAVAQKEPLSRDALWRVPPLLRAEVLEALLGSGKEAGVIAKVLKDLKASDKDLITESSGIIPNLYSRIIALQGLAVLHQQVVLEKLKIEVRLKNLHRDYQALRKTLNTKAE